MWSWRLDRVVLLAPVALPWRRHDDRVDHLPAHRHLASLRPSLAVTHVAQRVVLP
jgi:hypothetical protein